jgi:hypothetical protein
MVDITTVISVISAFVAAGGLFYSSRAYGQTARTNYFQLIKVIEDELSSLETSRERNEKHELFSIKYLNLHERLAYLADKNLIHKDIVRYFEDSFQATRGLLNLPVYEKYKKQYFFLDKWCTSEQIIKGQPPLPASGRRDGEVTRDTLKLFKR